MVAGDQQLIHTPFVPSGYWSPCAPLVWNQGFTTSLGGLSMSTNPVKAPDVCFSSSHFRKQHPRHKEAIIQTEEKGRGIIATRTFYEGEFVVEYAGDLISEKLAKQREAVYKQNPAIGSYMFFFVHAGQRYCVDATEETSRLGRLINHSRLKPNCIVKVIPIDGVPRLALFARKSISPGEELLYDYGDRDKETLQLHPWLKT
ncbi:unnamed protein product [Schistosoma mattheei]|uniref:Uncharacterized protein n=1 Tax=Schistosoma mattheei TaxID=31246 RepID=A0A183PVV4_9TREM|nr:unnamed protein product [Schistosoma mattheei]